MRFPSPLGDERVRGRDRDIEATLGAEDSALLLGARRFTSRATCTRCPRRTGPVAGGIARSLSSATVKGFGPGRRGRA